MKVPKLYLRYWEQEVGPDASVPPFPAGFHDPELAFCIRF